MIKFCKLSEDTVILFNKQKLYKLTLGLSNGYACHNCFYNKPKGRHDNFICSDLLFNDIGLICNDGCITNHFDYYLYNNRPVFIEERVQEIKCSLFLSLYLSKIKIFNINLY